MVQVAMLAPPQHVNHQWEEVEGKQVVNASNKKGQERKHKNATDCKNMPYQT